MWTRSQLKERAKSALNKNYWRIILVTLIVFVIGGASASTGINLETSEIEAAFEEGFMAGLIGEDSLNEEFGYEEEFYYEDDFHFDEEYDAAEEAMIDFGIGIFFIAVLVIVVIASVIGFFLSVFLYCPLEVGTKRFFFKTLNQPAEVKEVAFAFDNNYKNVVKILFFRELYLLGWSLLFVIPGIIKTYEYQMVPYLLAENPNLTKEQAFTLSKQMMTGNKWNAFVLDLSFIGWELLSSCTLGILSIFYVEPYKNLTYAALYEELSLIHGRPATAMQQESYVDMNPYGETMTQQVYDEPMVEGTETEEI